MKRSGFKPKVYTVDFYSKKPRKPAQARIRAKKPRKPKKPTLTSLKKKLWELVKIAVRNKYRNPDGTYTCYTCDKRITEPGDAHTAHFIASSVCGASLRFNMRNLRICCYKCNVQLGGNGIEYYPRMVAEIGQEEVDKLKQEAHNILIKADVPWYEARIAEYSSLSLKEEVIV